MSGTTGPGLPLSSNIAGVVRSVLAYSPLLDDDLDPAVLRLADVVAGWHQQLAFALADDRDRLGRHAVADEGVLDRVGATQRQRHVVGFRTRRVGVAGRRDAGAALGLEGIGRLLDRGECLLGK